MKYYKLGYYANGDTSKPIKHEALKPMTHKQACTMKSKMMQPANWFLYEVKSVSGEQLAEIRGNAALFFWKSRRVESPLRKENLTAGFETQRALARALDKFQSDMIAAVSEP